MTDHTAYSPKRVGLHGVAGGLLRAFREKELVWEGTGRGFDPEKCEENVFLGLDETGHHLGTQCAKMYLLDT